MYVRTNFILSEPLCLCKNGFNWNLNVSNTPQYLEYLEADVLPGLTIYCPNCKVSILIPTSNWSKTASVEVEFNAKIDTLAKI